MSFDAGLLGRFLKGDKRACSRIISIVEDARPHMAEYLEKLQAHTGRAHIIGITGPPGVGKSSLINRLSTKYLECGKNVGVIAVDPSSPFSGGAVLGDRIRMGDISLNPKFYFRSMSSRGSLGGLSHATIDASRVLDAFGKDIIIIETVGTGQSEVDIMEACDTVIVVTMPGTGDDIQAQKAGIMEIGNIFVINKSDRDGAERTLREIQSMLMLNPMNADYEIPVVMTKSNVGEGIEKLIDSIDAHYEYLKKTGRLSEKRSLRSVSVFEKKFLCELKSKINSILLNDAEFLKIKENVAGGRMSPDSASIRIMEHIEKKMFNAAGK